jgi:hypothetical protein
MAQRLSRRLTPLALLAAILAAVPGPTTAPGRRSRARTAGSRSSAPPVPALWKRCSWSAGRGVHGQPWLRPHRQPDQRPVYQRHRAVLVAGRHPVAFARGGDQDDGLPFHIHTVSLASGRTSQVTGGKVQNLMPSWQPL